MIVKMLAHERQNQPAYMVPRTSHMHALSAWIKQKWGMNGQEKGEKRRTVFRGTSWEGILILNAFHAGFESAAEHTLLAEDDRYRESLRCIPLDMSDMAHHPAPR